MEATAWMTAEAAQAACNPQWPPQSAVAGTREEIIAQCDNQAIVCNLTDEGEQS